MSPEDPHAASAPERATSDAQSAASSDHPRPRPTAPTRPVTVGHRGASALAPENTLRAFAVGIEHGLDFAELDVHLDRDGQLVVIHDADLSRVAGRPPRVGDLTADELARIDVGDGEGVPRLADVFDLVRGRLGIYVELKGAGTGAALGRLVRSGATSAPASVASPATPSAASGVDIIAGSFVPALVDELRAVAPEVPRSVLFARTPLEEMIATCRRLDATYAHPCFRPIDREMIDALHAAGLLVMTPHTNDPAEARHFTSLGVDVIASDDPRILAPLKRP